MTTKSGSAIEATPPGINFNETEPEFIAAIKILDYLNFDTSMEVVRDDAAEIATIIVHSLPRQSEVLEKMAEALKETSAEFQSRCESADDWCGALTCLSCGSDAAIIARNAAVLSLYEQLKASPSTKPAEKESR